MLDTGYALQAVYLPVKAQATAMAVEVPKRELFINGRWIAPARGQYLEVVCPATEEVIGRIPAGSEEDVNAAVAAAVQAHKEGTWGRSTGKQRAQIMRQLAQKVRR
jgi:betaine-aldehyde dehydrogenase